MTPDELEVKIEAIEKQLKFFKERYHKQQKMIEYLSSRIALLKAACNTGDVLLIREILEKT